MANEVEPTPPDKAFEVIIDGRPVRMIDSTEVCVRLGIDRGTLTRWIQLGRIQPAGKMPGVSGAYLWDPKYINGLAIERAAAAERAAAERHDDERHAS